jgi:hypothetical protein
LLVHVSIQHDILDNHRKYVIVFDRDSPNMNNCYMSNNDYHLMTMKLDVELAVVVVVVLVVVVVVLVIQLVVVNHHHWNCLV